MKKYFILLVAALSLAACEKDDPNDDLLYAGGDIKFFHNSEPLSEIRFDKETGGTITIETKVDAFILGMGAYTENDKEIKNFYSASPPEFILKLEDIEKCNEYVCQGCKVVRNGFRKFTITVNPNIDWMTINLSFNKIIESKEYGKVAAHGGTVIPVYLK